jgi:hypothetical protein
VADQSDCAGVGVGVGVTEADGNGEGDCPAVEKFAPKRLLLGDGVGTAMGWGRIVVTLAAAMCAPAFVFAVVFVPARAFVPICVAPVELPLELLSPPAAAPVIAPVGLLMTVCTPGFIPMCAPAFVFSPVLLILLGGFVPSWPALVELPGKPLCPAVAGVVTRV